MPPAATEMLNDADTLAINTFLITLGNEVFFETPNRTPELVVIQTACIALAIEWTLL
jgi:hypothetical protein